MKTFFIHFFLGQLASNKYKGLKISLMSVVCLINGRIIRRGRIFNFARSYWGKMNAESENLHSILNRQPNSIFCYIFSHGFVTGEIKNRAVK